jgi:hypothetical protein
MSAADVRDLVATVLAKDAARRAKPKPRVHGECMHCGSVEHHGVYTGRWQSVSARDLWLAMGAPSWIISPAERQSGLSAGRVYFIEAVGAERIKIGWTAGDPRTRLDSIATGSPFPLRILAHLKGTQKIEQWMHRACKEAHAHNEWFRATPELRELIGMLAVVPGLCFDRRFPS